jgi:PAS domain S-box-containing protein
MKTCKEHARSGTIGNESGSKRSPGQSQGMATDELSALPGSESWTSTDPLTDRLLLPDGEVGTLDLAGIVDIQAVKSLMVDFYRLTCIPVSIIDVQGQVLVGVGWQDVCLRFHRVHPQTRKNCLECDTQLTTDIAPGEFKLYKCKNNMWDVATPIMVGGRHLGNLFSGQFFFDDEPLDYPLFKKQAALYGFEEDDYLASLESVQRLSREYLATGLEYLIKLVDMISQMSYSNLELAGLLRERDLLTDSLRESTDRFKRVEEIAHLGSWEFDTATSRLKWSDEVYRIFGLQKDCPVTYQAFLDVVHPEDLAAVTAVYSASLLVEGGSFEIEHRIVRGPDGEIRVVHEKCEHLRDATGKIVRSVGMVHDITERKRAEEQIRRQMAELREINEELTRFNKVSVGRELRMIELKKEVNQLCRQAGAAPRYPLDFEQEQ